MSLSILLNSSWTSTFKGENEYFQVDYGRNFENNDIQDYYLKHLNDSKKFHKKSDQKSNAELSNNLTTLEIKFDKNEINGSNIIKNEYDYVSEIESISNTKCNQLFSIEKNASIKDIEHISNTLNYQVFPKSVILEKIERTTLKNGYLDLRSHQNNFSNITLSNNVLINDESIDIESEINSNILINISEKIISGEENKNMFSCEKNENHLKDLHANVNTFNHERVSAQNIKQEINNIFIKNENYGLNYEPIKYSKLHLSNNFPNIDDTISCQAVNLQNSLTRLSEEIIYVNKLENQDKKNLSDSIDLSYLMNDIIPIKTNAINRTFNSTSKIEKHKLLSNSYIKDNINDNFINNEYSYLNSKSNDFKKIYTSNIDENICKECVLFPKSLTKTDGLKFKENSILSNYKENMKNMCLINEKNTCVKVITEKANKSNHRMLPEPNIGNNVGEVFINEENTDLHCKSHEYSQFHIDNSRNGYSVNFQDCLIHPSYINDSNTFKNAKYFSFRESYKQGRANNANNKAIESFLITSNKSNQQGFPTPKSVITTHDLISRKDYVNINYKTPIFFTTYPKVDKDNECKSIDHVLSLNNLSDSIINDSTKINNDNQSQYKHFYNNFGLRTKRVGKFSLKSKVIRYEDFISDRFSNNVLNNPYTTQAIIKNLTDNKMYSYCRLNDINKKKSVFVKNINMRANKYNKLSSDSINFDKGGCSSFSKKNFEGNCRSRFLNSSENNFRGRSLFNKSYKSNVNQSVYSGNVIEYLQRNGLLDNVEKGEDKLLASFKQRLDHFKKERNSKFCPKCLKFHNSKDLSSKQEKSTMDFQITNPNYHNFNETWKLPHHEQLPTSNYDFSQQINVSDSSINFNSVNLNDSYPNKILRGNTIKSSYTTEKNFDTKKRKKSLIDKCDEIYFSDLSIRVYCMGRIIFEPPHK